MAADDVDPQIKAQRDRIIKAFETIGLSTAKLHAATDQQVQAIGALFEAIAKDKDGLICAIDDLIVEIQGLRQDVRAIAKATGIQAGLASLFGAARRR